jgi:hypothetical protein
MSATANPLIKLIAAGKIRTLQQLRSTYRALIMKSHPDAVGSDKLLEKYLSFSSYYEEAKLAFQDQVPARSEASRDRPANHRLAYFRVLQNLERMDRPYGFHRARNLERIMELKSRARFHFERWNAGNQALYDAADRDYDRLKAEKPSGPYMKNALAINISPVFYNILAYHLTGYIFYKKQVKQNLQAVMQKLADHRCQALKGFLEVIIDDMNEGPAVFGDMTSTVNRKLTARQKP